jgi:hypothetical protein
MKTGSDCEMEWDDGEKDIEIRGLIVLRQTG